MNLFIKTTMICSLLILSLNLTSQKKTNAVKAKEATKETSKDSIPSSLFSALKFRSLGPVLTSGRISDLAVNPNDPNHYFVAVASGGVWKTTNSGVTFDPVFDGEGSYSIGCLAMDPKNTNVLWVGTGENNNQRSVAYGDGIYKTEDGGKSWKNMGLKNSEHIGRISIDPVNSDIVYVAAYGPLWSSGGERGIYKTTDGGVSWKQILKVSDYTGFNEVFVDPRFSNIVYAAAHQRQRKVFSYIGGGPESALYKSTDAGATWNKIMSGMPTGDIGRIGLNYAPSNPDILYAVVEASENNGGVYKSMDRGASWEKQSSYSTSGNYYQKIYCDPKDINKIFVINTYFGISKDGGKSFSILGEKNKHIDNHVIWIDPNNTKHYLVGCDGGLYETFDAAENWLFKPNLPVTQFYKVSTDNAFPFYNIHGGTQDNFSIGGPSRTTSINGIVSADWFFTSIGDGFETQVDQSNPDIIYAQSQYGGLIRYDKKNGEFVDIKPIEQAPGEAYKWNWDAPLLISKFNNKRLYFAANKVFRTDDQGSTWKTISGDLSRNLDRNKLMVMDKVWSVDAIAKNGSTDIYGNITSISESPFDENILYAGTDDGLIHTTLNGGANWTKIDNISGVPERSYVHQIICSQHEKNTAYVVFNHHRYGDFHPYIFKTTDGGNTWSPIQNNLPERGSVYSIAEDHVNKNLLFAGTEFGVFFSVDGGQKWIQLKAGLPTIAVRDIEIQRRENDLVLGTFGRGFYVLDDYSPLRTITKENLEKEILLFPIKDSWMYIESTPLGVRGKGFQGESFFTTANPKVGAVFTYHLKNDIKTLKEKRKEVEAEKAKKKETIYYPSLDSLRMEDVQVAPHLLFTIRDEMNQVVRRLKTAAKKGLNRILWDFRYAPFGPVDLSTFDESFVFSSPEIGYRALPGTYTLSISKFENGIYTDLGVSQTFNVKALNVTSLAVADKKSLDDFSKKLAELRRITSAVDAYRNELVDKLKYFKQAILETPKLPLEISKQIFDLEKRLHSVNVLMNGDASLAKREFETTPSINGRIGNIVGGLWSTTAAPSQTYIQSYEIAQKQFASIYKEIKNINMDFEKLEQILETHKSPYTPGRLPDWKDE
ncbi:MAG: glycosyl hydrolase [Saprospiraceae bacterium]|nr:glycosyl hydrolase [Saprospiraceae bacterium]